MDRRKEKTFDAVKMVREIRDEHHEKLKDKSWQERVAFYKEEAEALREETKEKRTAA
jgi:hypothetical protein